MSRTEKYYVEKKFRLIRKENRIIDRINDCLFNLIICMIWFTFFQNSIIGLFAIPFFTYNIVRCYDYTKRLKKLRTKIKFFGRGIF